ncbi:GATA zinc finger domain-containing protein 14-like [Hyposmocoma kahamanoa]|uniref:GATA zinc finger domain-containing protein 14-like n=1 Tax=Hyposmocoma kahamanoa TaxID=1477025 RepID=UPI000E6D8B1D|nr:GATA zinc finger domain-containing protein 14-like [Hyposmocoma kahamanoa]
MPYYCTVPRCTSMAGKAKNVSFHQFPRDEELAKLWNKILKRGKPYTKYSKVCSLHFRPEDYTITSVGKNKGQWRTLRKDAIPSQNLPSESPVPTPRRSSGAWVPSNVPGIVDPRMQQQMAQAIYLQTMLAMQTANGSRLPPPLDAKIPTNLPTPSISDLEQLLQTRKTEKEINTNTENQELNLKNQNMSYKCTECSKCFKDPDVFVLHKRTHGSKREVENANLARGSEKENIDANNDYSSQETLRANPILANLLKSGVPPTNLLSNLPEMSMPNVFDANNVLSIENQIMTTLAANMENYIRNLSNLLSVQAKNGEDIDPNNSDEEDHDSDQEQVNSDQERHNSDQDLHNSDQELHDSDPEQRDSDPEHHNSDQEQHNSDEHTHNLFQGDRNSDICDENSDFDNDYLNEKVSNSKYNDVMDRNNDFVRNGHISDHSVQDSGDIDISNQSTKLNDQTFDNNYQNYHQADQNSGQSYSQNYSHDFQNYDNNSQNYHQDENNSLKDVQSFDSDCQNCHQDTCNSDNDCQNHNQNCNDNQNFDKIGQMLETKGSILNEPSCDK